MHNRCIHDENAIMFDWYSYNVIQFLRACDQLRDACNIPPDAESREKILNKYLSDITVFANA